MASEKKQQSSTPDKAEQHTDTYFYPEYEISIVAASREDADKELEARLQSLKEIQAVKVDDAYDEETQ